MPNYIVDASIVADFLLPGNYTANAEALIRLADSETRLLVPEFCLVECTNALWKRVQRKEIVAEDAARLEDDLQVLPLTRISVKLLLSRALQIGVPSVRFRSTSIRLRSRIAAAECATRPTSGSMDILLQL